MNKPILYIYKVFILGLILLALPFFLVGITVMNVSINWRDWLNKLGDFVFGKLY